MNNCTFPSASSISRNLDQPLILASSSPYRRDVLARLGIHFECVSPNIDEYQLPGEDAKQLVERLALAKAAAVAAKHPGCLVLGGDQVLEAAGAIFGKPGTAERAREQLSALAGKAGVFHTGLAAVYGNRRECIYATTQVVWRNLTAKQITDYIAREPAFDCAGSAKLEGLGVSLLESLSGTEPTAILGVPLIATSRLLRRFGVLPD